MQKILTTTFCLLPETGRNTPTVVLNTKLIMCKPLHLNKYFQAVVYKHVANALFSSKALAESLRSQKVPFRHNYLAACSNMQLCNTVYLSIKLLILKA